MEESAMGSSFLRDGIILFADNDDLKKRIKGKRNKTCKVRVLIRRSPCTE